MASQPIGWKLTQADLTEAKIESTNILAAVQGLLDKTDTFPDAGSFDTDLTKAINTITDGRVPKDANRLRIMEAVTARVEEELANMPGDHTADIQAAETALHQEELLVKDVTITEGDLDVLQKAGEITARTRIFLGGIVDQQQADISVLRANLHEAFNNSGVADKEGKIKAIILQALDLERETAVGGKLAQGIGGIDRTGDGQVDQPIQSPQQIQQNQASLLDERTEIQKMPDGPQKALAMSQWEDKANALNNLSNITSQADPSQYGPNTGTTSSQSSSSSMMAASVNVGYARKWGMDMTAASKVTARIKAVPPPEAFQKWVSSLQGIPPAGAEFEKAVQAEVEKKVEAYKRENSAQPSEE